MEKYQSKVTIQRQNQYLDYLIDPSFSGVNRLFVLSFEDNKRKTIYQRWNEIPFIETKDHIVKVNGHNFFDQSVKGKKI